MWRRPSCRHAVLRAVRHAARPCLPGMRRRQPARAQILRSLRRRARPAGDSGAGGAGALRAPAILRQRLAGRRLAARRDEAGHGLFLRHRRLDTADRAARTRGDARARSPVSRNQPRRGAPLWRHRAAIQGRWLYGAVRSAGDAGRSCPARAARRARDPAGAGRRHHRGRGARPAGADRCSHRPGRLRTRRQPAAVGRHGDRRHRQCRRPAGSRPPSRARS